MHQPHELSLSCECNGAELLVSLLLRTSSICRANDIQHSACGKHQIPLSHMPSCLFTGLSSTKRWFTHSARCACTVPTITVQQVSILSSLVISHYCWWPHCLPLLGKRLHRQHSRRRQGLPEELIVLIPLHPLFILRRAPWIICQPGITPGSEPRSSRTPLLVLFQCLTLSPLLLFQFSWPQRGIYKCVCWGKIQGGQSVIASFTRELFCAF